MPNFKLKSLNQNKEYSLSSKKVLLNSLTTTKEMIMY